MTSSYSVRIVGPGRAGGAIASALADAGWNVVAPIRRGESLAHAAEGVDLLLIATPDGAIAEIANAITPVPTTVIAHLSGAVGLDVLAVHSLHAAIHPHIARNLDGQAQI